MTLSKVIQQKNFFKIILPIIIISFISCNDKGIPSDSFNEINGNWNLTHMTIDLDLIINNDPNTHPYDVPIESLVKLKIDNSSKKIEFDLKKKKYSMSYEIFTKENVPYLKISEATDNRLNGIYTISFSKTVALRGTEYGIEYIAYIESEHVYMAAYRIDVIKHDLLNGQKKYLFDF